MEALGPNVDELFCKIFNGINFKPYKYNLFRQALTHKSMSRDNYERLECLGDGWLKGFILSAIIKAFPDKDEGFYSNIRYTLERTETFAELMENEFPELTKLIDVSEEIKNVKPKFDKVKEDVFEALVGALITYVFEKRVNLIYKIAEYYINMFVIYIKSMKDSHKDYITNYVKILNDHCYNKKCEFPKYELVNKMDTGLGAIFKMKIELNNTTLIEEGPTIKEVKQKCAQSMLNYIKGNKKYENEADVSNVVWYI